MYHNLIDWTEMDKLYEPKRKINNASSWKTPYIIGSFFSAKMNRVIHYQALNEFIFYALLELDERILRYYYQPLFIPVKHMSESGIKYWQHVPDVLVFKKDEAPHLYQIKESNEELKTPKNVLINKACSEYTRQKCWDYSVVCPKQMPENLIRNIKFLIGFVNIQSHNKTLVSEILYKMRYYESVSVKKLADSFICSSDPYIILPIIYNMITKGLLQTNLTEPINENSQLALVQPNLGIPLNNYKMEEHFFEIKSTKN